MKRFIVQTAQLLLIFGLIYLTMVWMASVSLLIEHKGIYNFLYAYQLDKIQSDRDVNTVFVGDSSLGNTINADLFTELTGKNSLNTALTGLYGYAGSYNIIKATHRNHPELKNVVLIHTVDMSTRGVSFPGYAKTVTSLDDILELSWRDMKIVLSDLIDLHDIQFSKNHQFEALIVNDYIKQVKDWDFEGKEVALEASSINPNKTYFLQKIITYCQENSLNLIYCHGPHFDKTLALSGPYIARVNQQLAATGLNLIEQTVGVPNAQLGDSEDHVVPPYKDEYTRRYVNLIEPLLDD